MRPSLSHILLLFTLSIIAQSVLVDAKRCKKNGEDETGKGKKCGKKGDNNRKGKLGRSKDKVGRKKPVAPFWRKGPPPAEKTIVREGTKVTLTCAIKGNPSPKFTWLRNRKKLTPETSQKIRIRRHRLTIQTVLLEDMGKYTCQAKNAVGALNFTFSLWILENIRTKSIEVVDRPENQTAQVGDTAIFMCRSEDWPRPNVQWTRQTQKSRIIEDVTYSTRHNDNSVLVLHNVTKADSGRYTCYIGNDKIHKELSATLTVIEEGERLPFEPQCGLHMRRQVYVDHEHGCNSSVPVEMHYCMGSCGRSYYIPRMMTEDSQNDSHLNQTCSCCVGVVESLRIIELDCFLGKKKRAFYPLLRGCQCQSCHVEDKHPSTTTTTTPASATTTTTTTAATRAAAASAAEANNP